MKFRYSYNGDYELSLRTSDGHDVQFFFRDEEMPGMAAINLNGNQLFDDSYSREDLSALYIMVDDGKPVTLLAAFEEAEDQLLAIIAETASEESEP